MEFVRKNYLGVLACLGIAAPSWYLGRMFPIIGGAVIAIIVGMLIALIWNNKGKAETGIKWTSKIVLQAAVVLLGFGMNLGIIMKTGMESLPIIICTIAASLLIAWGLHKGMRIPEKISVLIGVGSSICGGSAVAAAAPVVKADDEEIAQSISVIFFFNVLAALIFPILGKVLGFDTTSGNAFGIFAGTAVNDTSSVTAVAATWDSMWNLGCETLDKAVTVKLTRTLAIIPITMGLAFLMSKKSEDKNSVSGFSFKKSFPMFILYFVIAAVITTLAVNAGISQSVFSPVKELSKFLIVMSMAAIGLNCNIIKLIKTGGKPILLGLCCWAGITAVSLLMQYFMGLW